MGKKLRKFNRATHRDLGYFFVGMILIYSLSGIAINHIDDWDPNYVIKNWTETLESSPTKENFDKKVAKDYLKKWGISEKYKRFYWIDNTHIKVFFKGGRAIVSTQEKIAKIETISIRPIFHTVNWLHYNPNAIWKWFSDIFAGSLIILAISGMFILRGKNGMKWRGTILVTAGILLPLIYLIVFYF